MEQRRFLRAHLMKSNDLKRMSTDDLWELYQQVNSTLVEKIKLEKAKLIERLRKLESARTESRRTYPPVHPKYKNPDNPMEVWSCRGRQPRWVREQLKTGKRLDQLLIVAKGGAQFGDERRQSSPKVLEDSSV
jgi:DNA-binding protein H-NS